jgi:hypothetical protein
MNSDVTVGCSNSVRQRLSTSLTPLYEFHSQWNLQSNIENPVNTQKHGELFHASWNLKLYLVLRPNLTVDEFSIPGKTPGKNSEMTILRRGVFKYFWFARSFLPLDRQFSQIFRLTDKKLRAVNS